MSHDSILFTPTTLGDIPLANRVVMAPMTRNRSPGNVPNALNAEYYAQRAGAGLIITEGTAPEAMGRGYIDIPGLYNEAQVAGWRAVAAAVHAKGGRIAAQLMHVGRISHPDLLEGETPIAPSAIAAPGDMFTHAGAKPMPVPRAMTEAEIARAVASYGSAARNAVAANLDGVEVHAANGYLPSQFLAPNTNQRSDGWGGSIANRARFVLGAVDAAIGAIGAARVGIRVSPGGTFNDIHDDDVEGTYTHLFKALAPKRLAWLHIMGTPPGLDIAALAQKHYGGKVILAAGYDRAKAEADLGAGRAEAIAFGVPFLANPDLPVRLHANAPLNAADSKTFYGGGAPGYTDYPPLAA
jgi:N-ethylmaleimide reductase